MNNNNNISEELFHTVKPPHKNGINSLSFAVLCSGSKGNSVVVLADNSTILIDVGISARGCEILLNQLGICASQVDAVLLTHEHTDHIRGVRAFSRRHQIPVFINERLYKSHQQHFTTSSLAQTFQPGETLQIASLELHPFSVSHDAVEPVCFTIKCNGVKLGIATDLGYVTSLVATRLSACDALVVEANHDSELLLSGPYPWQLKQRIKSRTGHLSNSQAGSLLRDVWHPGLRTVVLAHISEKNNQPQLALNTVLSHLTDEALECTNLYLAQQRQPTPLFSV